MPAAIRHERWQANRRTGARYDVRDEDFANVVAHFEAPWPDERALLYDQSRPLATWIACAFG